MRRIFLIAAILGLLSAGADARTWKSADGTKSFEGTLRSFDKNSGNVKVVNSQGKLLSFDQSALSEEDRKFLLSESSKPTDSSDPSEALEKTKVGKQISSAKLKILDGKRFKSADLEVAPEYYILYYAASW